MANKIVKSSNDVDSLNSKLEQSKKYAEELDNIVKNLSRVPTDLDIGIEVDDAFKNINDLIEDASKLKSELSNITVDTDLSNIAIGITKFRAEVEGISKNIAETISELTRTGNVELGLEPGDLKKQLNAFVNEFFEKGEIKISPITGKGVLESKAGLAEIANEIKEIKDNVQAADANVTRFGRDLTIVDKAFGFDASIIGNNKSAIDSKLRPLEEEIAVAKTTVAELERILETARKSKDETYIAEFDRSLNEDSYFEGYDYSRAFSAGKGENFDELNSELIENIKKINKEVITLEGLKGKVIKGYVDIYNDAISGVKKLEEYNVMMSDVAAVNIMGSNNDILRMTKIEYDEYSKLYDNALEQVGGFDEVTGDGGLEALENKATQLNAIGNSYISLLKEENDKISNEVKAILKENEDKTREKTKKSVDSQLAIFNRERDSLKEIKDVEQTQLTNPETSGQFRKIRSQIPDALKEVEAIKKELMQAADDLVKGKGIGDLRLNTSLTQGVLGSNLLVNLDSASTAAVDKLREKYEELVEEAKKYKDIAVNSDTYEAAFYNAENNNARELNAYINNKDSNKAKLSELKSLDAYSKERYNIVKEMYEKEFELARNSAEITAIEEKYNGVKYKDKHGIQKIDTSKALMREYKKNDSINVLEKQLSAIGESIDVDINIKDEWKEELTGLSSQLDKVREKFAGFSREKVNSGLLKDASSSAAETSDINKKLTIYSDALSKMSADGESYIKTLGIIDSLNAKIAQAEKSKNDEMLNDIKRYVSDREAIENRQYTNKEKYDYYDSQLDKFKQNSREYIEVLKLRNAAERQSSGSTQTIFNKISSVIRNACRNVNNVVNKIIDIIRKFGQVVRTVASTISKVIGTVTGGIRKIISLFGGLSNRVKQFSNSKHGLNILSGTATELRSKISLLKGAFDTLFNGKYIESAKKLYSSVHSLDVIIGKSATQSTIDWAYNLQKVYGLSATNLISDLQEVSGVMYGLGMQSNDVAIAGKNFVMMSRYLGYLGFAGGSAKEVMSKLTSGMKGMTASIDDLGLSVRESQMQTYLDDLNKKGKIAKTSWVNLNEEARVYARYASLIEQFTKNYDLSELENSLDTVYGRADLVKERFESVITTIGQVFLKLYSQLAGFITIALTAFETSFKSVVAKIDAMFSWLDLDITVFADMNKSTSGVSGNIDSIAGGLEDAAESSAEIKGNLSSVDRLDSINSSNSSSKSGKSEFDYSKLMTSALDGIDKKIAEATESYSDKLKRTAKATLKEIENQIKDWVKDITGRYNIDLGFDFAKLKSNLKSAASNIKTTVKNVIDFIASLLVKIGDDVNIGRIITAISKLVNKLTELARKFSSEIFPVIDAFYEEHLKPIFESAGKKVVEVIDGIIGKIDGLIAKLYTDEFKENFANGLEKGFKKVRDAVELVTGTVRLLLVELGLVKTSKDNIDFKSQHDILGKLAEVIGEIKDTLKILWDNVLKDLLKDLGKAVKNDVLPWLLDKIKALGNYIKQNGDKIIEFIEKLASFAWETLKKLLDLFGGILKFGIENPDTLIALLKALVGIKIGKWAFEGAAGILDMISKFTQLKNILNGGGLTGLGTAIGGGGATTAAAGGGLVGTAKLLGTKAGTTTTKLLAGGAGAAVSAMAPYLPAMPDIIAQVEYDLNHKYNKTYKNYDAWQKGASSDSKEGGLYYSTTAFEDMKNAIAAGKYKDYVGNLVKNQYNVNPEGIPIDYDNLLNKLAELYGISSVDRAAMNTQEKALDFYNSLNTDELLKLGDIEDELKKYRADMEKEKQAQNIYTLEELKNSPFNAKNNKYSTKGLTDEDYEKLRNTLINLLNTGESLLDTKLFGSVGRDEKEYYNYMSEVLEKAFNVKGLEKYNGWDEFFSAFNGNGFDGQGLMNADKYLTNKLNELVVKEKEKLDIESRRTKTSTTSIYKGYANGGVVKSGSLFMANENGKTELVGNFGGYTGVANNGTILIALKDAIGESVYNAIAEVANEVLSKFSSGGGNKDVNINFGGVAVSDENSARALVDSLLPFIVKGLRDNGYIMA